MLVMDDDRIQQGITREMLPRSRIHCDCCTDVRELMDCLKSQEYDLLLTDIQMPGADGFSILELLRGSNIPRAREIPAIAVTAHSDREEEYLFAGFAGCIHKPFSATGPLSFSFTAADSLSMSLRLSLTNSPSISSVSYTHLTLPTKRIV